MPKAQPKPPPTPGSLITNSKLRGEWAELRFMTRVAEHGIMISKPWGDSARYDLMIEHHGRVLRIQVKSTMRIVRGCYRCHLPTAAPTTKLSSRAKSRACPERTPSANERESNGDLPSFSGPPQLSIRHPEATALSSPKHPGARAKPRALCEAIIRASGAHPNWRINHQPTTRTRSISSPPTSSHSTCGTSSPPQSPPASTDTSPCPHIARATNTSLTWKPGICCCKSPPPCHPDRSEA
jgi:hypothetical protein